MLKIARFLKNYKKQVILGPIFKLFEAILELTLPIIMAKIIDYGIVHRDIPYVLKMGFLLIIIAIVGFSSSLICQHYASIASQGFGTVVRNELFTHINSFSYKEIDKFGTPSLITRIINDVNQLQFAVAMLIRLVIRAPFLAIGAIVMAMIIDFKLSLIFLAATPIIAVILYIIIHNTIPYFKSIQKKLDSISLITRENLGGVRVIRSFSRQDYEEDRFYDANIELSKTAVKVGKISALLNPLTYIILNFSIIAIMWVGGIRVDYGSLTQGQIIALVNYMGQILLALIVVSNLVIIFTKASASASRVNEVLETSPSITNFIANAETQETINYSNKTLSSKISSKIEFKDVSFSYDGNSIEKSTLEKISFQINPNETIGILGGTGSGKSTIINLISRFYDSSNGEILIDGVNIKKYPLYEIRNKIGIVPQTPVLFSGTIKENIQIGNMEASDEDIKNALNTAMASEFINKLPKGHETYIEQNGKNLSGGQKQRITIARALIGNPEILILDDSFSSLDYSTESKIRNSLKNITENNTTLIIVSQRISTIKNADKILVLDNGSLIDIGTHDILLKRCSLYKEINDSQNKSEKEDN